MQISPVAGFLFHEQSHPRQSLVRSPSSQSHTRTAARARARICKVGSWTNNAPSSPVSTFPRIASTTTNRAPKIASQGGTPLRVIDVTRKRPLAVASDVKIALRNVNPMSASSPHVSPPCTRVRNPGNRSSLFQTAGTLAGERAQSSRATRIPAANANPNVSTTYKDEAESGRSWSEATSARRVIE
jgi:hypothetical protein